MRLSSTCRALQVVAAVGLAGLGAVEIGWAVTFALYVIDHPALPAAIAWAQWIMWPWLPLWFAATVVSIGGLWVCESIL